MSTYCSNKCNCYILFRCAKVKRQRERDKGKMIKMEFEPHRVGVECTGYQPDELGKAFGSMRAPPAIEAANKGSEKKHLPPGWSFSGEGFLY